MAKIPRTTYNGIANSLALLRKQEAAFRRAERAANKSWANHIASLRKAEKRRLRLVPYMDPTAVKCLRSIILDEIMAPRLTKTEKLSMLAARCEWVKKLVWDFREMHGWKGTAAPHGYFAKISRRYGGCRVSEAPFKAINFISSRQGIYAIEQRHRMRQKPVELEPETLKKLQGEMKLILRWLFTYQPV